MRQSTSGLCVPVSPDDLGAGGEVSELTYRLTAWNETGVVFEDYRHKISHRLILGSTGISRKGAIRLFELDKLNLVLRTKAFPGENCLQFVC